MQHENQARRFAGGELDRCVDAVAAGQVIIGGWRSSRTLEADFNFAESYGAPVVDYHVTSGVGRVDVTQDGNDSPHFGVSHNDWNLRFNDALPLELKVDMGAGDGRLRLRDVPVTRLSVEYGSGARGCRSHGDRTKDVDADVEGGVGQATVRLPRKVGVIAHASGGIGGISLTVSSRTAMSIRMRRTERPCYDSSQGGRRRRDDYFVLE